MVVDAVAITRESMAEKITEVATEEIKKVVVGEMKEEVIRDLTFASIIRGRESVVVRNVHSHTEKHHPQIFSNHASGKKEPLPKSKLEAIIMVGNELSSVSLPIMIFIR